MKLSFSIKGWEKYAWADTVRIAREMELQGIELRSIHGTPLTERGGPFHAHMASATLRELYEAGLSLPCIDAVCDIADEAHFEENCREIADCIETARQFRIPNIRVHATSGGEVTPSLVNCLREAEVLASRAGVTVLIETVGIFADTGRLRDVLNDFASDYLAVLWDLQHPYRINGETPDRTIQNLGAYVRHVHVKDSVAADGKVEHRLVGEGDLPIPDMMNALRSVNYDGFLSLEWDPAWLPELDDLEVVLPHYVNYMTAFHDPSKARAVLY
ncbi:MAG: sugar phosphate isomerase/epimerase, partial [Oscillospiraceae bacterium]|nr:sugar phosphate isomerase/epimerase [Oscillospiraceae bacterium]